MRDDDPVHPQRGLAAGISVPFVAGWGRDGATRDGIVDAFRHTVGAPGGAAVGGRVLVWQQGDLFLAAALGAHAAELSPLDGAAQASVVSGVRLQWTGEDAALVAPDDPGRAGLDGRWVTVDAAADQVRVRTDDFGAGIAFAAPPHASHRTVTNVAGLLARLPGAQFDHLAAASAILIGTTVRGAPTTTGAARLWAGADLVIGRDGAMRGSAGERWSTAALPADAAYDVGVAAHRLVSATRALAQAAGDTATIAMSGGRDSRVVLSALVAGDVPRTGVVLGDPASGDLEVALELCRLTGTELRTADPKDHGDRERDAAAALRTSAMQYLGTASIADAHLVRSTPGPLGGAPWLTGQAGEIARGFYGPPAGPLTGPLIVLRMASRRPGRPVPLTARGELLVGRQVGGIVRSAARRSPGGAQTLGDAVYFADRMQRHFSGSLAMFDPVNPPLMPLWSQRVVRQMLAIDPAERRNQRFHRDMVRHLTPELVEVPLDSGKPWDDGAAGATTLAPKDRTASVEPGREKGADEAPLQAAQRELGQAIAAVSSGDEMWKLVDRGTVEQFASREAGSLDFIERQSLWRTADVLTGRLVAAEQR